MSAASSTVRVIGPWCVKGVKRPSVSAWGMRPKDGFMPNTPQQLAGILMEPAPSLPSASGPSPAATAAAAPPLEPPAIRSRRHGFRVGPNRWLSVTP